MKNWIKGTFTDNNGTPSFKRQIAAFLTVIFCVGLFTGKGAAHLETVALLIGGVLSVTGIEKFSKN